MIRILLISVCFFASGSALAQSPEQLNKSVQDYLDATFEGKNLKAIGYGGGSQFKPKTFWIYLDILANAGKNSAKKARPTKGWIVLSSGKAVHSDEMVPISVDKIELPVAGLTQEKKLGLLAALTGAYKFLTGSTKVSFDDSEKITIKIEIEEAVEERVELIDILLSQHSNAYRAKELNKIVIKTFGASYPVRMINSAIKVRGVKLVATVVENKNIDVKIGVAKYLIDLGFKYNKDTNSFESLQFDDWHYLAYSSIYTRGIFNISSSEVIAEAEMHIDNIVTDITTKQFVNNLKLNN